MGSAQKKNIVLLELAYKPGSHTDSRLAVIGIAQEDVKKQRAGRKPGSVGS